MAYSLLIMYCMFINILFSVILTLTFMYIYHFQLYGVYLWNSIINYDRTLFGYSCNILFLTLQPSIYWLYSAPQAYVRMVEYILYISGFQWFFAFTYSCININIRFTDIFNNNNSLINISNSINNGYLLIIHGRYRITTSSSNSLHSFGISNMGIKIDCIPGRYINLPLLINKGYVFGRCYELCGHFHHAMIFSLVIV